MANEKISKLHILAVEYHEARGTKPKGVPTGRKFMEEAAELLLALRDFHHKDDRETLNELAYEIADVAITLDYIAADSGLQVEECIKMKTMKDKGRG